MAGNRNDTFTTGKSARIMLSTDGSTYIFVGHATTQSISDTANTLEANTVDTGSGTVVVNQSRTWSSSVSALYTPENHSDYKMIYEASRVGADALYVRLVFVQDVDSESKVPDTANFFVKEGRASVGDFNDSFDVGDFLSYDFTLNGVGELELIDPGATSLVSYGVGDYNAGSRTLPVTLTESVAGLDETNFVITNNHGELYDAYTVAGSGSAYTITFSAGNPLVGVSYIAIGAQGTSFSGVQRIVI